ncbi:MAG: hypothetical protein R3261_14700, partial [Alphaproteobacteria bacterium]|nr:hypothetical protein [Alphaproteobacteria bacterium]
ADLTRAGGICEVNDDNIRVFLNIKMAASRGPALKSSETEVGLIIAITDLEGKLIAPAPIGHRNLPINLVFPENQSSISYRELVMVEIPRAEDQPSDEFNIYVSLAMTPAEYEYNKNK